MYKASYKQTVPNVPLVMFKSSKIFVKLQTFAIIFCHQHITKTTVKVTRVYFVNQGKLDTDKRKDGRDVTISLFSLQCSFCHLISSATGSLPMLRAFGKHVMT